MARPGDSEPGGAEPRGASSAPLGPALERARAEGAAEYGPLPLDLERFAALAADRLRSRLERAGIAWSAGQGAALLEQTARADLFLTAACEAGVPEAWERFSERFRPRLIGLARRSGLREGEADDAVGGLLSELSLPPPGGGARTWIGTFEGGGSLFSWLAVILVRRVRRRARPEASPPAEEPAAPAADPAELLSERETAARLEALFSRAWTALGSREALAVLYRFRDGCSLREAGGLLDVSETRVSRIVTGAVDKFRDALERAFPEGAWRGREERDRVWRALRDAAGERLANPGARGHSP
jgi:RNA polymerase sigma factor (sigma-70 family)